MGHPTNATITPSRRRSQRVLMQVGIVVRGADTMNRKFEEEAETLSISAHGALILLSAKVATGSKVVVKHKRTQEEQECSVVFLGATRGSKCEIGIEFSKPSPTFWRVAFPPEDWTPRHPEARSAARIPAPPGKK
jgi:hypothetical protein